MSATQAWPAGARIRTLDLDGPVHLTEYGDPAAAETMVCLHGLGGSALNFGLIAPELATRRRVLVPDLLGHGRSYAPERGSGAVRAQLRMVEQLLEAETHGPVILAGHSMGGVLAMLLAVRAPARVGRLIVLDPPSPNVTRWSRDPRLTAKSVLLRAPGMAGLVARKVTGMTPSELVAHQLSEAAADVGSIPEVVTSATVAEVEATRGEDGGRAAQLAQFRAIVEVVDLLARPREWRKTLARITAPTLWLQGDEDPLAPLEAARALAATRPDWSFWSRAKLGHLPHLEEPGWCVQSMERWLDGCVR